MPIKAGSCPFGRTVFLKIRVSEIWRSRTI